MPDHQTKLHEQGAAVTVHDAEEGALVTVAPETVERWRASIGRFMGKQMASWIEIAHIADERLWLAGNYTSFEDFIVSCPAITFGERQADKYKKVGRKLIAASGSVEGARARIEDATEKHFASDEHRLLGAGDEQPAGSIHEIGISILSKLADDVDDDEFAGLLDAEPIRLPDGRTYSVHDLINLTGREYDAKFRTLNKKNRDLAEKNIRLEEEKALLESEREADRDLIKTADDKYDEGLRLQAQFGAQRRDHEHKRLRLMEARALASDLRAACLGSGLVIEEEDTDGLKTMIRDITKEIATLANDVRIAHYNALRTAPEGRDFPLVDPLADASSTAGGPTKEELIQAIMREEGLEETTNKETGEIYRLHPEEQNGAPTPEEEN